jgi:type III pantothenate kinase
MSLNLCIDWGNTNIKAAIYHDNRLQKKFVFTADDAITEITSILDNYKPQKAVLCAVVGDTADVISLVKQRIPGLLVVSGSTRVPINNAYLSQETLGPDRLVLVNAAYAEYPNKTNLVVSLGTCITYNLVQQNKTFRGGAISPGLQMRIKALHTFTDLLPELNEIDEDPLLLGYDTDTCMQSGIVNGMAAEIDGMIAAFESKYPDFNAILTGGDAPLFARKLKSKIFADPDLLIRGLNLILNYNVPSPS